MKATIEVKQYLESHTKNEAYLYNNRLRSSNLITSDQYNINRSFIKSVNK